MTLKAELRKVLDESRVNSRESLIRLLRSVADRGPTLEDLCVLRQASEYAEHLAPCTREVESLVAEKIISLLTYAATSGERPDSALFRRAEAWIDYRAREDALSLLGSVLHGLTAENCRSRDCEESAEDPVGAC